MKMPVVLGLLLATAAFAGTAVADNSPAPQRGFTLQGGEDWSADNDWSSVVDDTKLPAYIRDWCAGSHAACDRYEDWAESNGWWQDTDGRSPLPAPEINPLGAAGALTILATLVAIVRGRRPAPAKPT